MCHLSCIRKGVKVRFPYLSHITIFVNSLPRPRKLLLYQTQQAAADRAPALLQVYFHKWIWVRSHFTGPLRVTTATPDWETTTVRLPRAAHCYETSEGRVSCFLTAVSVYTHTDNAPARRHVEDCQRQLITVIAPIRGGCKTSHYGRSTHSSGSHNPYPIISLYDKLPAYQIPTLRSNYSLWHTKRPIVRLWLKVITNSHWTNEKCTVQGSTVTDRIIRIISRF